MIIKTNSFSGIECWSDFFSWSLSWSRSWSRTWYDYSPTFWSDSSFKSSWFRSYKSKCWSSDV